MAAASQTAKEPGLLELLGQIQSEHGLVVLVLTLMILFGCFLLWRLIWRVWSSAMQAKDDEIARLAKERDKYQALVFERLRTSQIVTTATSEKPMIKAEHQTAISGPDSPPPQRRG